VATIDIRSGVLRRLDRLNEFDREPVAEDKLYGGGYFAASYAGEHVAATEFVIGALFVSWGAGAFDILVGLLLGNLLAVLSWTLVCAPIATQTRLTLYWYLRKIAGPVVMVVYNVLNAVLYCILAGCMITVSASAVRIAFNVPPQTGWVPTDPYFVFVVIAVGAVVVTLAILGFKRLAQFASVCSPWMLLMFVAGALVMLPQFGRITGPGDLWRIADQQIWKGPAPGQTDAIGFWHVAAFAWICNLAMHLGLSDMALLRYAKRSSYGLYSAFGMYLGHYLAWICAGIMGAALAAMPNMAPLDKLDAGEVAFQSLGFAGAIAVVIAGWTTSNPTLYRSGLALQVVTPGWPRWLVTLLAGIVTTAVACFPFVFRHLLGFVAVYGIMLAPVGAIVVAEHWIFPRIGLTQYWSSRKRLLLNWPALVSWAIGLGLAATCWGVKVVTEIMVQNGTLQQPIQLVHEFFLVIPVWVVTTLAYIGLSAVAGARESLPELPEATPSVGSSHGDGPGPRPSPGIWHHLSGGVALACLALCVVLPLLVLAERMKPQVLKSLLIWVTLVYFAGAITWISQRERRKSASAT
jgi:cytosine permease